MGFVVPKDAQGWERIVFAEVIIPETLNVYGDYHTKESVRQFAYGFMINGFKYDVDHDNNPMENFKVVESFIAREGDPDFIEGSWVLGTYVDDDETWEKVLNGDINGYSYEALVQFVNVQVSESNIGFYVGTTEPNIYDGHVHRYFVVCDVNGSVITGGTDDVDGHSHQVTSHTFTERSMGHQHIYRILEANRA